MIAILDWWRSLGARDQKILSVAIPLVVLLLLYALVIDPWLSYHQHLIKRKENQESIVKWLNNAAIEINALRQQQKIPQRQTSLLSTVDNSARRAGLHDKILRIEPAGDNGVRLTLADLPFDDLVRWLVQLQQESLIVVSTISVLAKETPGLVQVRLELEGR
jgi:general secretion pathway protein M